MPLSFDQRRDVLSAALSRKFGEGREDCNYGYIDEIYDDYVIYVTCWDYDNDGDTSDKWRVEYTIGDNYAVTLGEPVEVIETKEYIEAPAEFGDATDIRDGYVYREGKIFDCGTYPDKDFSLSLEEAEKYVKDFKPVPFMIAHNGEPIKNAFLESIKLVGKTLIGKAKLPAAIDELIPVKRVSCGWLKDSKRLSEISFTPRPRIQDAALFMSEQTQAATPATQPNKETNNMALTLDQVIAAIRGVAAKSESTTFSSTVEQPANATGSETEELKALRLQLANERNKRIAGEAANFAANVIAASKALPAEEAAIVSAYVIAASNDENHGAVNFSGTDITAVTALKALFYARTPHSLTSEFDLTNFDNVNLLGSVPAGVNFQRGNAANNDQQKVDEAFTKRMINFTKEIPV